MMKPKSYIKKKVEDYEKFLKYHVLKGGVCRVKERKNTPDAYSFLFFFLSREKGVRTFLTLLFFK